MQRAGKALRACAPVITLSSSQLLCCSPSQGTLPLPRDVGLDRVAFFDLECSRCDLSHSLRSAVCFCLDLGSRNLPVKGPAQGGCCPFSFIPRVNAHGTGQNPTYSLMPSQSTHSLNQIHLTSAKLHLTCRSTSVRINACFLVSHGLWTVCHAEAGT